VHFAYWGWLKMGINGFTRNIRLVLVFSIMALVIGCGGGSSSSSSAKGSHSGSDNGENSQDTNNDILELNTLAANIVIRNIRVTNLDCLNITRRVTDTNNTSARALASDFFADLQTESQVTYRGSVNDLSSNGRVSSSSSLQYEEDANSIFMGSSYSLNAGVTSEGYGYAHALATISEMIYFTALKACDITLSFDYSGQDNGINPSIDPSNYSYAGMNYQIANFNDAVSQGLAVNVLDANTISPGTLSTTMHFDQGESGWITLGASAGVALYRSVLVLEEKYEEDY